MNKRILIVFNVFTIFFLLTLGDVGSVILDIGIDYIYSVTIMMRRYIRILCLQNQPVLLWYRYNNYCSKFHKEC